MVHAPVKLASTENLTNASSVPPEPRHREQPDLERLGSGPTFAMVQRNVYCSGSCLLVPPPRASSCILRFALGVSGPGFTDTGTAFAGR